jgi:hypothetical protein
MLHALRTCMEWCISAVHIIYSPASNQLNVGQPEAQSNQGYIVSESKIDSTIIFLHPVIDKTLRKSIEGLH